MMVLVTYDVNTESEGGKNRLRKVAKKCENYGQRVQNSVFECLVDPAQFAELKHSLCDIMDEDKDSLRFYYLGKNWKNRIEHFGAKKGYDPEGLLVA
ncbi:MAG TPA: CRISPR-associated endonuclease Cas2 [Methanosarcina sp.]|nr:CRISPR-associated endonuclease Cas2 [Methanosarcina sp.]